MEPKWIRHGRDRRQTFEKQLEPEELRYDLAKYQSILGKEFTIEHLLKLHDIRAKAFIAESICDAPEFLMDMIGVARKSYNFESISGQMADFNVIIRDYLENRIKPNIGKNSFFTCIWLNDGVTRKGDCKAGVITCRRNTPSVGVQRKNPLLLKDSAMPESHCRRHRLTTKYGTRKLGISRVTV